MANLLLWIVMIGSWLSLLLLKKENVKRYMPVALLGSLLVSLWCELAYLHEGWVIYERVLPFFITNVCMVLGAFLAGTIWIFHFTFGRFWVYLLTNLVIDWLLTYPISTWYERIGIWRLVRYTNLLTYIVCTALALVLYGYQMWQEGALAPRPNAGNLRRRWHGTVLADWLGGRQKAH